MKTISQVKYLPLCQIYSYFYIHEMMKSLLPLSLYSIVPLLPPLLQLNSSKNCMKHTTILVFFLYYPFTYELKVSSNHHTSTHTHKHFTKKTEKQLKRKSGAQTKVIADDINLGNNKACRYGTPKMLIVKSEKRESS